MLPGWRCWRCRDISSLRAGLSTPGSFLTGHRLQPRRTADVSEHRPGRIHLSNNSRPAVGNSELRQAAWQTALLTSSEQPKGTCLTRERGFFVGECCPVHARPRPEWERELQLGAVALRVFLGFSSGSKSRFRNSRHGF